jgi:hypothetical protein
MELEPSDTETEAMRFASAARSSEEKLFAPVMLPEHENIPIIARVMPAPLESLQSMMTLMNRATGFSRAAKYSQTYQPAPTTRGRGKVVATGNAAETARIYIRQAKRSFRHCFSCVVFS